MPPMPPIGILLTQVQIRVHLQHIGHPIVDDPLYQCTPGKRRFLAEPDQRNAKKRTAGVSTSEKQGRWGDGVMAAEIADAEVDSVCAHCPFVEPSEGVANSDGTILDSICLHSLAYSSSSWCYVTPHEWLPVWASNLPEKDFERLCRLREAEWAT